MTNDSAHLVSAAHHLAAPPRTPETPHRAVRTPMSSSQKKPNTAESLWEIANGIRDRMEAGQMPDANQLGVTAVAIAMLATDVEKLAADRDTKDARLRDVLALCSRADRQGVTSGGDFTVAAVRTAAQGATEQ